MKLKFSLLSVFLIAGITLFGQDWSSDTYKYDELYEGYVITKEGEKIEGYIKYRNRFVMQEEVIFFKTKTGSKKKYLAEQLEEYKVADKHYHCINYSGGASVSKIRANLVVNDEGCIKEYVWYERAPGYNKLIQRDGESDEEFSARKYPSKAVFLKDGDEMAVTEEYFKKDFTKKMMAYVKPQKELFKKVKAAQKGYSKPFNMEAIFKEYNENCQ
jgi:hypothetical protein